MRRTKIVCTLGPSSCAPAVLRRLISAGMDVARLNFSHGDESFHREAVEDYARRLQGRPETRTILVPAFDPQTLRMELRPASALVKHPAQQEAYELSLRYGRTVKVTGDHSVFVEGPDGRPVAKFAREIRPGESVAIPARLPVAERDRTHIHLD